MPEKSIREQVEEVRDCLEQRLNKKVVAGLFDDLIEAVEEEKVKLPADPKERCHDLAKILLDLIPELSAEDGEKLFKAEEE